MESVVLRANNVWTKVEGLVDATMVKLLDDFLSAEVKGAEYSDAYQNHVWDGRVRLFDKGRFPTGFVRPVLDLLKGRGIDVLVDDQRTKPPSRVEPTPFLRDYQRNAVDVAVKRTRGLIVMPTGAGKSWVFTGIGAALRDLRWIVFVDTKDLLHQAADVFEKATSEPCGRLGDGNWDPQRYNVATFQTLASKLRRGDPQARRLLDQVDGVIVDEVQILPADECYRIVMSCANAYYRLGVSATPLERADAMDLKTIGALGPTIYDMPYDGLFQAGLLAKPDIIFHEHQHQIDSSRKTTAWTLINRRDLVENNTRNELVATLAASAPKPCLLFSSGGDHRHGDFLLRRLEQIGVRAEYVYGETASASRRAAIQRLVRRDIDVLVASRIFNKGIDIPELASAVNGAGGAGTIDAVQRLGRVMRAAAGKGRVQYLDVYDSGHRYLERHALARIKSYQDRGFGLQCLRYREAEVQINFPAP